MTTAFLKVKNNAVGVLAVAIDGTTDPVNVVLQSGQGAKFPTTGLFDISIGDEILRAAGRTADTLDNCARGAQGTTPAAHPIGSIVKIKPTAKLFDDITGAVNALEAIDAGTRLTAVEAANTSDDSRLDALEALGIGGRLAALEAWDADTRLDALEALGISGRLSALEAGNLSDDSRLDALELKFPIKNADVDNAAAIALSKLATDPLARANHTGTQLASTISNLQESVEDYVGALFFDGGGVDFTYDDALGRVTAAIDHGGIGGLGDDDHLQYLLKTGRAGGQTFIGGTAAGDDITLTPGSGGGGQIILDLIAAANAPVQFNIPTTFDGLTETVMSVAGGQTISVINSSPGLRALVIGGTWDITSSGALPFLVFNFNPVINARAATMGIKGSSIYRVAGSTNNPDNLALGNTSGPMFGFEFIHVWTAVTGAGTATVLGPAAFKFNPTFGAGWTSNNAGSPMTAFWVPGVGGTGTILTLVGFRWDDLSARANLTNAMPMRVLGPGAGDGVTGSKVHSLHEPRLALGSKTANSVQDADTLLHLLRNTIDHTSITFNEETTDGPTIAASDRMRVYMKNDKFVVQFRDAGDATVKYLTVPLTGYTGAYPQAAAWAVDTAAP